LVVVVVVVVLSELLLPYLAVLAEEVEVMPDYGLRLLLQAIPTQ
jgi:hypothetical protein